MAKRPFNGSPTVDGYYTTFDSSEVHRIDDSGSDDQGGGGSSDFSTAEVKFESTNRTYGVTITRVEDSEYGAGLMGLDNAPVGSGANALTVTVPLYKGAYLLTEECITGYSSDPPPVVTGDLEYISGTGLMITGDGTFTAAG